MPAAWRGSTSAARQGADTGEPSARQKAARGSSATTSTRHIRAARRGCKLRACLACLLSSGAFAHKFHCHTTRARRRRRGRSRRRVDNCGADLVCPRLPGDLIAAQPVALRFAGLDARRTGAASPRNRACTRAGPSAPRVSGTSVRAAPKPRRQRDPLVVPLVARPIPASLRLGAHGAASGIPIRRIQS